MESLEKFTTRIAGTPLSASITIRSAKLGNEYISNKYRLPLHAI